MNNTYELAYPLQTTGWDAKIDVNSKNFYGMTPSEVALQAGNADEFSQIISHPDFDAAKMGRPLLFLDICRQSCEKHYRAVKAVFERHFRYDEALRHYVKTA